MLSEAATLSDAVEVRSGDPAHDPSVSQWLIRARGVRKKYCRDLRRSLWYGVRDVLGAFGVNPAPPTLLRESEFWAIDDVSFELRRGDSLAILGRNGAGKSTLLKLLTGQRSLNAGTVETRGRIVALTELGLGFNPVLTGRENAYVNAAVHGFSRSAFDRLIEEVIEFSELREFIDSAVQTYSSGMKARLGFSIATHLSPDILIIDEVLAVGDMDFKRKCIRHLLSYVHAGGSMLLVAHEPYLIQSICNRSIVLEHGTITFEGTGVEGVHFHFQLSSKNQAVKLGRAANAPENADDIDEALMKGLPGLDLDAPAATGHEHPPLHEDVEVVIDRIDVTPESGDALRTGHPAHVTLRYRSNIEAEVIWGFTFCTSDLQTNIASCARGMDGDSFHLTKGEHSLVCRLPDFPLQAGVYAVRGGIGDAVSQHGIAVLGYENSPGFFTVTPAAINRTVNFNMERNDLVQLKIEWFV